MFEDSLLESGKRLTKRNPWATVLSFALEGAAVGLLVLVPMIYTDAIPVRAMWTTDTIFAPPTQSAPRAPEQPPDRRPISQTRTDVIDNTMVQPWRVPPTIDRRPDPPAPALGNSGPQDPCVGCIPSLNPGTRSPLIAEAMKQPVIATFRPPSKPVPVSGGVSEGLLIRRVTPEYPTLAKQSRTQGAVVLSATIGKDGTIQNLQVLTGHPFLAKAAMDAVRQWRYRPYLLNGQPVDVETTITVNFNLN